MLKSNKTSVLFCSVTNLRVQDILFSFIVDPICYGNVSNDLKMILILRFFYANLLYTLISVRCTRAELFGILF